MIPLRDGYELVTPGALHEALADLAAHPGAKPFAGGTDLMVALEAGLLPPGRYISLGKCSELGGIEQTADGISIGARATYTQIRESTILTREYPLLGIAASQTGGVATQNRGTIGGNVANASPAADTPPALLVYDAELELRSSEGARRVPYADFHRGYKEMDLRPGELIARIHLPRREVLPPKGGSYESRGAWRDYYRKVGTRRAQAISKVCFAGSMLRDGDVVRDVRIALGSVAPVVIRARRTENVLRGRSLGVTAADAEQTLASEIAPIDDIRSTAAYRARVARNLLRDFLGAS